MDEKKLAPDPFDLESLRLPQDYGAGLGVKKLLTKIPVRRPDRQWFLRTHPTLRFNTAVVELKETGETYLVKPEVRADLAEEIVPKVLVVSITRHGLMFVWPIRLPEPDGRHDDWNASALEASRVAVNSWVAVKSNRPAGHYDTHVAGGNFPEPDWDAALDGKSLQDLLRIAFRDRVIDRVEHPVLKQLRGLA
jgi:hypothetical protein